MTVLHARCVALDTGQLLNSALCRIEQDYNVRYLPKYT